jgi:hypothetical protein
MGFDQPVNPPADLPFLEIDSGYNGRDLFAEVAELADAHV